MSLPLSEASQYAKLQSQLAQQTPFNLSHIWKMVYINAMCHLISLLKIALGFSYSRCFNNTTSILTSTSLLFCQQSCFAECYFTFFIFSLGFLYFKHIQYSSSVFVVWPLVVCCCINNTHIQHICQQIYA